MKTSLHMRRHQEFLVALSLLLSLVGVFNSTAEPSLLVTAVRCEGRENPLGVDTDKPMLGWLLEPLNPTDGSLSQSAYQILASSSIPNLQAGEGDLWDSGKVDSDQTVDVPYAGRSLRSSQVVYWKVRVWDQAGEPSEWSRNGGWIMGLLSARAWGDSRWIALSDTNLQSQLLRHEFVVKRDLVRAIVHVTGLGQYEMSLNGLKVGNDLLTPGWTDYRKTILYDTYDVTSLIYTGPNVAGITLGNGMYSVEKTPGRFNKFAESMGNPKAIMLLRLEYADGSAEFVVTDSQWKARPGPIVYSNVYGGEDYDARLNPEDWTQYGFRAEGWSNVVIVDTPDEKLKGLSAAGWPIRIQDTVKPVSKTNIEPGVIVYDLGQNAPIMPRLVVSGPRGSSVKIVPSELLKPDGSIDDTVCRSKAYWTYRLAGQGTETWFPQFFYRGGRYLQVELQPAVTNGELPRVIDLSGEVVHADAPAVGEFECSSDLFNSIYSLIRWAQRGNMVSILTDCPHREKMGWLEQDYLNGPALRYNFNLNPLFSKIVNDISDSQLSSGLVANIAPEYTVFGFWGDTQFRESAEWGSALIQIPWQQYLFTGELDLPRRHYENMKWYMDYLGSHVGEDGILRIKGSLGDWYDIGPKPPGVAQLTPIDLTATAIYYDDLRIMREFAKLFAKAEDEKQYAELALSTARAFNEMYWSEDRGEYSTGSQTANVMPLTFGMTSDSVRDVVVEKIVKDVDDNGLTAGDIGYRYLLRALADAGRSDVVFNLNNQTNKPGYGMQLAKGATSLTEAWDARRASSQNHFMLGQLNEWFFHDLAGIQPDAAKPGFKHTIIKPAIVGDLSYVKASYESVHGKIESEWQKSADQFNLTVSIPPNTTATVHVPFANVELVNRSTNSSTQPRFVGMRDGGAIYEVGSGKYQFSGVLAEVK